MCGIAGIAAIGKDRRADRLGAAVRTVRTVRMLGVVIGAAYVVRLLSMGGFYAELGAVVAADCVAGITLWRLGHIRSLRRSQLLENTGYLTVFAIAITVTVLARPTCSTVSAWNGSDVLRETFHTPKICDPW